MHFLRNVLAQVSKGSSEMVAAAIRTIFAQPDATRLAGAVLVEAHDERQATDRRYLSEATLALLAASPTKERVAASQLMTA